jgi:exopolysaccharide biosynthesis predicted pyruvyltransferase EpsI
LKQEIGNVLGAWFVPGEAIQYFPNPGNSGDALIAAATWQVFDRLGYSPAISKPTAFKQGASVILGGGGNLVPLYSDMRRALERCLETGVRRCLLLPHTIRGHEQLLSQLDGRFTLCCRDRASFEHVVRHAPHAIPILAGDMAFSIDLDALEKRVATFRHRYSLLFDKDWRKSAWQWRRALAMCSPDEGGRLTILRGDREGIAKADSTKCALDLPDHYKVKHGGRAGCDQVALDLFRCLRRAKVVVTDRLHVALPSALLGVSLEVIDNNYGKLSAVFDLSLPGKIVIRQQQ